MAARKWTEAQRRQQAIAIRDWQPWLQSSGPKSAAGKARVARNAYANGEWREVRELIKALNQALREQKRKPE